MKQIIWGISGVAGVAAIAVVLWSGSATSNAKLPYNKAENVARGAEIYQDYCASCHGVDLEGEANWRQRGPDGLLPAPPHDASGHTWHHPDQQLFDITKLGTAQIVGQGYQSNMIGFGDVLSDQQIYDVLGYIKSTWPKHIIEAHNARSSK